MSMDAIDIRNSEKEYEREATVKSNPQQYYQCEECPEVHERGDGCEWKTHPFPPQCGRCNDTGVINPGWAVMSFVDEPCGCINHRCHECFNLLVLDEDVCQRCGAFTRETNAVRVIPPEVAA